jgi:hypothetical protein
MDDLIQGLIYLGQQCKSQITCIKPRMVWQQVA